MLEDYLCKGYWNPLREMWQPCKFFRIFSFFSSIFLKKEEKENTLFSKDLETTW